MEDEPTSEEVKRFPNIVIDDKVILGIGIAAAGMLLLTVVKLRRLQGLDPNYTSGRLGPCAGCIERMRREQEASQHLTTNPAGNVVVPLPPDLPAIPDNVSPNGQYTEVVTDPEGRAY